LQCDPNKQTKNGLTIKGAYCEGTFILVLTVVVKGCYVELYSEQ